MMVSLTVLREQNEKTRFERLRADDSRTAIATDAVRDLEKDLRSRIRGEVRFDAGSRALYSTDGSNYRQVPIGVVVPREVEDVVQTVALARKYGAPILSRGCGTSLAGQCCNVAVVMDFSKYLHGVLRIDTGRKLATVQPGCVLDDLRDKATQQGLNFGPDPATHNHCTLGGMLGNDSCGSHSLLSAKHGLGYRTADNTHELEVLTYEGLRLRVGPTTPDELDRIIAAGGPGRGRRAGRRGPGAGGLPEGDAMKVIEIHEEVGEQTFVLVFETGDEVMGGLSAFAREKSLASSRFTAIGAFRSVALGYFDWEKKEYKKIPVEEQVEVLSLVGDVALDDKNQPQVHAHVVVGRSDGTTRGGHLLEGRVRPTLEVMLVESSVRLHRRFDPESGLALIRP
jgi:predicted DNA-binding protein with PD1-like motif